MQYKNVSSLGDLEVPVLGRVVRAGETVEVPDEFGFGTQPDVWQAVKAPKGDD